jgi:hypothetical protein
MYSISAALVFIGFLVFTLFENQSNQPRLNTNLH